MSPRMGSKRETYDAIHYIVPHVRAPGQRSAVCLTGFPAARRGFLRDLEEGGWTQEIFCREVSPSIFSSGFRNRCSVGVLAGVMAWGFAAVSQAQDKDAKGSEATQ